MISLLAFIIFFILIALIVITKTLNFLFPFFLIIFLILLFMIFRNILKNYHKYGKDYFKSFKKIDVSRASNDLLKISLSKLSHTKLIKQNQFYLLIAPTGLYLFYLFDEIGIIKGNISDEAWHKKENQKIIYLDNPFLYLDKIAQQLQQKYKYMFEKVLVLNNMCQIEAKYSNYIVLYQKDVYYKMQELLNSKSIYSSEQIEAIYNKLQGCENSGNN